MGIIPPSVGLLGTRMRFKIDSMKSDFFGTHPERILLVVHLEKSYKRAVPPPVGELSPRYYLPFLSFSYTTVTLSYIISLGLLGLILSHVKMKLLSSSVTLLLLFTLIPLGVNAEGWGCRKVRLALAIEPSIGLTVWLLRRPPMVTGHYTVMCK